MRTIEIVLGLIISVAAVALSLGAARLIVPIPATGFLMTLALIGFGTMVAAHGMTGRAMLNGQPGRGQIWRAIFYMLTLLTLTAAVPLASEALDLATVAGFPIGYYLTAQGILLLLAILAFRAAAQLDRLDARTTSRPPREEL
jgi:putative solute:sodium symporter small subunit